MRPTSRIIASALVAPAAVACLAAPLQAGELTPRQRNTIENLAQAQVGIEVCDSYKLNPTLVGLIAFGSGLRLGSVDFKDAVAARTSFHRTRIAGRTRDDICAAVARLFGPAGSNVKNLVIAK